MSAEALIDDPGCSLLAGTGPASDVALLIVPDGDEARFQVRDHRGVLFGDELPFVPTRRSIGRRDDGRVVVILGDMETHHEDSPTPERHGHARVYWGGQIIYENEKLWEYEVASDGLSFFVVEPLAGDTSRLVVRNLNGMEERHFDLGRRMTYFGNHGRAYGVYYSPSMSEVVFGHAQELNDSPVGDYWFYPNDGGGPRVVRIRSADVPLRSEDPVDELDPRQVRDEPILGGGVMRAYGDRVHFVSSELAYHLVDHERLWGLRRGGRAKKERCLVVEDARQRSPQPDRVGQRKLGRGRGHAPDVGAQCPFGRTGLRFSHDGRTRSTGTARHAPSR